MESEEEECRDEGSVVFADANREELEFSGIEFNKYLVEEDDSKVF